MVEWLKEETRKKGREREERWLEREGERVAVRVRTPEDTKPTKGVWLGGRGKASKRESATEKGTGGGGGPCHGAVGMMERYYWRLRLGKKGFQ